MPVAPGLLLSGAAWAHGEAAPVGAAAAWGLPALLACAAVGYLLLWRRAPRAQWRDAVWFGGGLLALAAALTGPLERWSGVSLAAHMGQHLLLMAVAAPLLVVGLPARLLAPLLRHRRWARRHGATLLRAVLQVRWLLAAQPLVLLFWHLPQALSRALASEPLHFLMHGSLLAVALPFWGVVLGRGARRGADPGGAALLLLTTMTVMALMGAVLTLAPRPLYTAYPRLADQQLAGLLMWIPATLPYLAAAIWLGARRLLQQARGDA